MVFKRPGDPNVISQGCPERRIPNSENSASAKKNILLLTVATLPTWRQLAPRFDSNPPKKTWAAAAALQVEKADAVDRVGKQRGSDIGRSTVSCHLTRGGRRGKNIPTDGETIKMLSFNLEVKKILKRTPIE